MRRWWIVDWALFSFVQFFVATSLAAILTDVVFGRVSRWPGGDYSFATLMWSTPLFGALWTMLFRRWCRRRRYVPGFCRKCDYDLTGNVSGRCPECGTPTEPPPPWTPLTYRR
jgi:hypothetical protein